MTGTVIGGTAMSGSLGMATGPGRRADYDTLASYTWLDLGPGMGWRLLIAMTFRLSRKNREQVAPLSQGTIPRVRSS